MNIVPYIRSKNITVFLLGALLLSCGKTNTSKFGIKELGLSPLILKEGKTEFRLDVFGYPHIDGEMIVLQFSKSDTTGFVYCYRKIAGAYSFKKIVIKPKISWAAILDSLQKFNLFSLPNQPLDTLPNDVAYNIQFADSKKIMDVNYYNPYEHQQDIYYQKTITLLNFLDSWVVPIYSTIETDRDTISVDDIKNTINPKDTSTQYIYSSFGMKEFGLDSLIPRKGKTELRLDIESFPWFGGEMIVFKFSKSDTTGIVYRNSYFKTPKQQHPGKQLLIKKIRVKPKISWAAVLDSLRKFELFSIPNQPEIESRQTFDGKVFDIEFTDDGKIMDIQYHNPDRWRGGKYEKVKAFLHFIDSCVVPIYHAVLTKDKILKDNE